MSKQAQTPWHAAVVLVGCVVMLPELAAACPWCKEALLDPGQAATQSRVAQGYALSIAALLGIPVMCIGGIAAWVAMAVRRTRAARRVLTPR